MLKRDYNVQNVNGFSVHFVKRGLEILESLCSENTKFAVTDELSMCDLFIVP